MHILTLSHLDISYLLSIACVVVLYAVDGDSDFFNATTNICIALTTTVHEGNVRTETGLSEEQKNVAGKDGQTC